MRANTATDTATDTAAVKEANMREFTLPDLGLALLYALAIVLVYFLSPGSSGVFIYQGF